VASVSSPTLPSSVLIQPNTTGLAPGDYTATVPVTSTVAGVAPSNLTVTYHVVGPLVVNPTSLTFTGGANNATIPAQQTVAVTSTGSAAGLVATTTYTGPTTGWLTATLVGTSTNTTLNVRPNTTGLSVGTYNANVRITSTTPGVAAKDIPVTYFVNDLSVSSSTVTFPTQSSVPTAIVLTVRNLGNGNITGVTVSPVTFSGDGGSGYAWLNPVLGSSTVSNTGTSLTLNVTQNSVLGDVAADFTISAPGITPKTVRVNWRRLATLADALPALQSSTCIGCHTTGNAVMGINFATLDLAFSSLNQSRYITPGDSSEAANYFVRIVDGVAAASGDPNRPFGCPNKNPSCLSASDGLKIFMWILH
jgi:hypothetical protein